MLLAEFAIERSTFFVTVAFKDENGNAVTPESARWTLSDGNGAIVNSRNNVAIEGLDTQKTITLAGLDLQKFNADLDSEGRVLTVAWAWGSGKTAKEELMFYVKRARM